MKTKIYLILIVLIFISLPVLVFAQEDGGVNFSPQVNIPGSDFAPGETVEVTGNTFADYIIAIYNWGIRIIIVLAVIMIMIGGFMWMTAAGSSQRIGQAKDRITSAIVGLILALGSYTLLNFVNPELVSFRSLTLTDIKKGDYTSKQGLCNSYLYYIGPGSKCYEIKTNEEKQILLSLSDIGIGGLRIKEKEFKYFKVDLGVDGNYVENCDKENDFQAIEIKYSELENTPDCKLKSYKREGYGEPYSMCCIVDGTENNFCDNFYNQFKPDAGYSNGAGIKVTPSFDSERYLTGISIKLGN